MRLFKMLAPAVPIASFALMAVLMFSSRFNFGPEWKQKMYKTAWERVLTMQRSPAALAASNVTAVVTAVNTSVDQRSDTTEEPRVVIISVNEQPETSKKPSPNTSTHLQVAGADLQKLSPCNPAGFFWGMDIFGGDVGRVDAASAQQCCERCQERDNCLHFTFTGSQCWIKNRIPRVQAADRHFASASVRDGQTLADVAVRQGFKAGIVPQAQPTQGLSVVVEQVQAGSNPAPARTNTTRNCASGACRADVVVMINNASAGRSGHLLKDLAAAVILASIFGWSLAEPQNFNLLSSLFDVSRLANAPTKDCRSWPRQFLVNGARWGGIANFSTFKQILASKQLSDDEIATGNMCVRVAGSWRVQFFQLYEWELQGHVAAGTYQGFISKYRTSVRRPPAPYWKAGDGRLHVAVHQRRGDQAGQQSGTLKWFQKAMQYIAHNHSSPVAFHIITESSGGRDVFVRGCSFRMRAGDSCDVSSKTVESDFGAMMAADVLLISSSSLSSWASVLGQQKAVFWMPYLDYGAHGILHQQYFAPCKHPPAYHCLDFEQGGDAHPIPCSCSGHAARGKALEAQKHARIAAGKKPKP